MAAEKVLVITNILSKIVIKSGRHVRLFCPQQTKGRAAASLMSLCFSKDGLELLDPLPPSPRSTGIIGVMHHHTSLYSAGHQTQGFVVTNQALCLSYVPSPTV